VKRIWPRFYSYRGATDDQCLYRLSRFRTLFPEYNHLSEQVLAFNLPSPRPWALLGRVALIAFVPPLLLLVVGSLLVWVVGGFRRGS